MSNIEKLATFLKEKNYKMVGDIMYDSIRVFLRIDEYYSPENMYDNTNKTMKKTAYAVVVADWNSNKRINRLTIKRINQMVTGYLKSAGIEEVKKISLVICDDIEMAKEFASVGMDMWFLDIRAKDIVLFEDMPEDFDDFGKELKEFVENGGFDKHIDFKKDIPYVTISLCVINTLIFLFMIIKTGSFNAVGVNNEFLYMASKWAVNGKYVFKNAEFYRLFTAMFVHYSLTHLTGNMFSLILLGNKAEKTIGRLNFIMIYLTTGIIANALSGYYNYSLNNYTFSAGASGAIYGILGTVMVVLMYKRQRKGTISNFFLAALLLIMAGSSTGNVDNIAHMVGFVTGIIGGIVFGKKEKII